ncbi:MAG: hypothetical protein HYU99_03015 [Deltaproteobacteria bacterium]|nr:hypothetical protein [Deltaproteobacteria bacterium]
MEKMIGEGGVNTLLLSTHIDFQSTRDWGKLTHANRDFFECEGFNCDVDLKYYEDTQIKPTKSKTTELASRDLFSEVARAAKKKGIQVYALILHRFPNVERYKEMNMRAVNGEIIPAILCHNHPEVRQFYKCLVDHLDAEYNLDGFCYALLDHYSLFGFQTLTDELANTLGIKRFANPEMGLSCFCDVCAAEAAQQGINVEKIKRGLMRGVKSGSIPGQVEKMTTADEAIRFLLDVPQYLEWLRFRSSIMERLHRELYEYIKEKEKHYTVGLDIYGAKDDWKYQTRFHKLAAYCDWIKPMFYSCTYDEPLSPQEIGDGVRLAKTLSGKPIFPGINCLASEPEDKIKEGIKHAMMSGADGLILSWDYSLIPFSHLRIAKEQLEKHNG